MILKISTVPAAASLYDLTTFRDIFTCLLDAILGTLGFGGIDTLIPTLLGGSYPTVV